MSYSSAYNFGQIANTSASIGTNSAQLQQLIDEMDQLVNKRLQAVWAGQAGVSYQVAAAQWGQAAANVRLALARLGAAVGNAGADMRSTDLRNSSLFI